MKEETQESFLCIVMGIFLAIVFIALMCGEADKGLIEFLF